MPGDRVALYTTVYPGVEGYLAEWYNSVQGQTDQGFDLWIGVDELALDQVCTAIRAEPNATWVMAEKRDTPASIRQKAIARIIEEYKAVVFVDSDDLMYPDRVATARAALRDYDVAACALRIIDAEGQDLGIIFGPEGNADIDSLLPFYNVFGLSNSSYRTSVLRDCLPIPAECVLIDWLMATRAWAHEASMSFSAIPQMAYRQHEANTARVLSPFTATTVLRSTQRVLGHYRTVLCSGLPVSPSKRVRLIKAYVQVEIFYRSITRSTRILNEYVRALNAIPPQYVWWWCVANPNLEEIWRS